MVGKLRKRVKKRGRTEVFDNMQQPGARVPFLPRTQECGPQAPHQGFRQRTKDLPLEPIGAREPPPGAGSGQEKG